MDNQTSLSEERFLDAAAIETAAKSITRPTARAHLDALVTKLRRDGTAMKRAEASKIQADLAAQTTAISLAPESAIVNTPPKEIEKAAPRAISEPLPPVTPTPAPSVIMSTISPPKYNNIDRFSFDAGGYNSQFVTLYIPLTGVGSIPKSDVKCEFTPSSMDLVVLNLEGKSYRMYRDNLDKDIDPAKSKYIIKADKVVVKLAKIKGEYGSYDHWSGLTAKKKKAAKKDDPSQSIMELMKDMYDSGDDNMKKMIGETMMKQQRGELGKGGMDDDLGKYDL
jgi:calcyclin binding protein